MSNERAETAPSSEGERRGVLDTEHRHDYPHLNGENHGATSAEGGCDADERSTSTGGEERGEGDGFVRAHVHALQFAMDADILSRIMEDKEALRAVSLQVQNGHGSIGNRHLDAEACQRVGRLVRLLTAYLERVQQDACVGRLHAQMRPGGRAPERLSDSLEQCVGHMMRNYPVEALEERVRLFESEAVHQCVCLFLPNLLGFMMQDIRRMPVGAMAGLVVMWARLCGELLSARMLQMMETGRCFALRYEVREASDGNGSDGSDGSDGGDGGDGSDGSDGSEHVEDRKCGNHGNRENCRGGGPFPAGDDLVGSRDQGVRVYASHDAYVEQIRVAFDTLTDAVKLMDSMLDQIRVANPHLDGRDHGEHLRQMVFEMERLEPTRLTDWVDMDARQMPTDQGLWGRFHAAILVDVFGKMEGVMEALRNGESLAADAALLKFIRAAVPVLVEGKGRIVEEALVAVCDKYCLAFDEGCGQEIVDGQTDAEIRSGLIGFAGLVDAATPGKAVNVDAIVASLLPALGSMYGIVAGLRALHGASEDSSAVASAISSLEQRVIWCLFSSKNVSEQLLSVTSLIEILEAVEEMDGSHAFADGDDEVQRVRISWIRESDILSEMLKVNLHHAQYVEDMLLLLGALAVHDLVDGRHVAHLWSTIQDEGTFDEIKSNVCQLLGFLATSLATADAMDSFCRNVQATCDAQTVEAKYVEEMMLAAANHDPSLRLMVPLVDIALGFCLNGSAIGGSPPNRTKRMLSGDLLLDITRKYLTHCRSSQNNGPVVDSMCSVIGSCMDRITAGSNDEGGGAFGEPDAVELLQPLRLLLRIVSGVKIPSDALDDIYKVVNDGAKLMSDIMGGYEWNLVRISQSDHTSELLRVFNAILRSVLSESNYYVEVGKVRKILSWAIAPEASTESTTYAWNLLTYLVQGEKGITSKTARLLLTSFMEEVKILDRESWLCLTAYVAACLDFESSLAVADSYVNLIAMTEVNRSDDIWGPLKGYLCGCLLTCCETDGIAAQCSKLLSRMLITDMDMNPDVSNLQQVKENIESFMNRLMDNPERVMMFLSDILDVYDYRECDDYAMRPVPLEDVSAGQQAAVSVVDSSRAPLANGHASARPLYACYRDSDMSFKVVLKNLPMSPRPGGHGGQHGVDVSCPRNCMIADLRAIVSLQASHLVGYMIPPANFNLHSGGKTLTSNISRVFEWVEDGGEVVAVFNTKVSLKTAPLPGFQLSHMMAEDEWFFGSLMALGDQGSRPALELITRLPISSSVVQTISRSFADEGQHASEDLGISFMLYTCRLMHSSISPMAVEGVPSCSVAPPQVQVPAWRLLQIMSQLVSKVRTSMGGDLMRTVIHLTRWIVGEDLRHDCADGHGDQGNGHDVRVVRAYRAVALELLHDVVSDALTSGESSTSTVSLDDVRFVASGALRAILDLAEPGHFEGQFLGPLIKDIKAALWHSDGKVREVGMLAVQALCCEQGGVERVLLHELVSVVLLCESQPQVIEVGGDVSSSPPKEQLQICSWFVDRMDTSLNDEMLNIAEIVCQRIMRCLGNRQPIDGYSRCLQIALLRVDATDLPSMKSLVSEILDTFLLGVAKPADDSHASSGAVPESYFESFRTRKYALDHQDGIYRVLLSNALLSEECWRIAHAGLRRFFNEASFPCLYNNRALESFRSLEGYCGLLNGGATCYMNATFQQLYMMPRLRRLLLTAPVEESPEKSSPVFEALRAIFLRLFAGVDEVVDPSCFWKEFKDYNGNPVDVREHQDGYEFFTRLQDAVDEYLKSLGHDKIMRSVLGGSFNQVIEVPGHEGVKSEREEEFYQISVDVRSKKDLVESLESYVAPETLDGPNQWFCESLGHKVNAKKRTLIKKLPESLVFHLKRFEWDYETYQRWKIKDRFEFPLELDMGPYLDGSCDAKADGDVARGHIYDLSGIIVHSGTAFAGHYYSFAKERSTGRWFHFDDDSVTPWDVADIEQECFGGQFQPTRESKIYMRSQSAYMVMYDRRVSPENTKTTEGTKGAGPTHSLAWREEFDDTCASVPASRLQELVEGNRTEAVKSMAFSESLAKCMSTISKEVECATQGPSARKAKVNASPSLDAQAKMPFHSEVFHVHRGRDAENQIVVQAVVLGLEYISRIAVCGPIGGDPAVDVLQPLISICQEPRTATFILSQSSTVDSVLGAMASPYKASRSMLRNVMATCAKASVDSIECTSFVEKVLDRIKSALDTPALFVTWRDLLGLLCDISQSSECTRMLANYTEILLSFSETMFELWRQQTKHERAADSLILTSYAVLACKLLRHHRLSNSEEGSRNVQISNPFCIARDRELGFEPSTDTITHLVSIGMDDDALLLFLQFLSWESRRRSTTCVEAIVENLRTSQHQRQIPLTVQWLRMEDSTSSARRGRFLRSALGLFDEFDGNGWIAYNISLAIASVLTTSPSLASSTFSTETREIDLTRWARKQAETCLTIARRLGGDGQYRDQWISGIPSSADDELRVLYDPSRLLEAIKTLLGDSVVDVVEEAYEIDLVKASSDEDEENDGDEVKEIELD